MPAEEAHKAVPTEAPTNVGTETYRGSPADKNPQLVVKTTRELSLAFESSAILDNGERAEDAKALKDTRAIGNALGPIRVTLNIVKVGV